MKDTKNLRVAVIGPGTRFLSGISYYTIRLCNALSELVSVDAILFRDMLPKRLFPGWKRVGINTVSSGFSQKVQVSEIIDWYNPFSWARAAKVIRSCDVVILQWWTSSIVHMYLALLLLKPKKTRFIIEFHEVVDPLEHGILPLILYAQIGGRILRNYSSRFIVHSEHDCQLIMNQYHLSKENIGVIPVGLFDQYEILDKETCKQRLNAEGKLVILFFGLIRPYKGVLSLIRAFERLPEEIRNKCNLIIAGEAWEDHETVVAVQNSPASDAIQFHNRYIADVDVPDFFSAADILVLPYVRASQSAVAQIGVAYGLPIIATRVGGLVEGLCGYEGATFIDSNDPGLLKTAIETQLNFNTNKRHNPPIDLSWERIAERFTSELCSP